MIGADRHGRPDFFDYYVFESREQEPTEEEQQAGVYLVGAAEAHYLQQFFSPLYRKAGIGLSTSNDEIISGRGALIAVGEAVDAAIHDVERRTTEWPVTIGYTFEPFQEALGAPIVEFASRARLLEFLRAVAEVVERASVSNGHVHFGGGG
jgi:hypothetical protein